MSSAQRGAQLHLMQMAVGYWRSQVLFTALELGVFDQVGPDGLPAVEISRQLGTAAEHTERLLNACATLGLLRKCDGRYFLSSLAERHLRTGAPDYVGHWLAFVADCYRPWGRLTEVVRGGTPAESSREQLQRGDAYTRLLILAMHDYALGPGRHAVERLDLAGRRRLLDVGGGPGTYSIILCNKHPELAAEVLDLPCVLPFTRRIIAEHGMEGRVGCRVGDYHQDDFGSGWDVVLLSNVLHQETPEGCCSLLRKAHAALKPGGLLVIQLSFLNREKDGPAWSVLQGIQLAVLSEGGRTYSLEEILGMLPECGFSEPRVQRLSLVSVQSLVLATKP